MGGSTIDLFETGTFLLSFFSSVYSPLCGGGALIVDIGTLFSFLFFGSVFFFLMGQGGVGLEGVGWWWWWRF